MHIGCAAARRRLRAKIEGTGRVRAARSTLNETGSATRPRIPGTRRTPPRTFALRRPRCDTSQRTSDTSQPPLSGIAAARRIPPPGCEGTQHPDVPQWDAAEWHGTHAAPGSGPRPMERTAARPSALGRVAVRSVGPGSIPRQELGVSGRPPRGPGPLGAMRRNAVELRRVAAAPARHPRGNVEFQRAGWLSGESAGLGNPRSRVRVRGAVLFTTFPRRSHWECGHCAPADCFPSESDSSQRERSHAPKISPPRVGVVVLGVTAVGLVGEKWGNRRTGKWAWSHCGPSHCAPSAAWAWSHCGSSHSASRHCGCSDSQPPQSARSHSPLPQSEPARAPAGVALGNVTLISATRRTVAATRPSAAAIHRVLCAASHASLANAPRTAVSLSGAPVRTLPARAAAEPAGQPEGPGPRAGLWCWGGSHGPDLLTGQLSS